MNQKGQTLVMIMGIVVVFMICIPPIIYMVQHEAKWTVKQKKTTSAFQASEAGIDRALWKLNEASSNWNSVVNGTPIPGYTGLATYDFYADAAGTNRIGQYKVLITTSQMPGEILVQAKGRDSMSDEVRAIEVVLTRNAINGSLNVDSGITWKPNMIVHWGPVVTFTSIDMAPSQWYPRKYSKGQIVGRDTAASAPNSDEKEYWAFEDLGNPPQIDLAYYKELAKKSQIPTSSGGGTIRKATGSSQAVATPAGSGYFRAADNGSKIRFFGSYDFRNSTSVIYVEGAGMDFANASFLDVQAALAEGNVDFNAGSTVYVASVPATAGTEYVKQKEMAAGYTFPGEGSATYSIASCGMHGFLYCGGALNNAGGNSVMVGAAKVIGDVTMNTFTIYYDAAVAGNIRLSSTGFRRKSWREIHTSW
jgi:hypothetical protein